MNRNLVILGLFFLSLPVLISAQTPFDDKSVVFPHSMPAPKIDLEAIKSIPLPIKPLDPLASATPEAITANSTLSKLIADLTQRLKAKDFSGAGNIIKKIDSLTKNVKTKTGIQPGLLNVMETGGVHVSRLSEIRGRISALKKSCYGATSSKMLSQALAHEDISTRKGPGGGNVACAWLMSKVLRAAGMVPPGWNENGALALTQRLVKECGWTKSSPPKGQLMKASQMKPGDIIYWDPSEHVGVYLGDGMAMSNSSSESKGTIHPVSGYYAGWKPKFVVRPPGSQT
jgi:hypothetical protein